MSEPPLVDREILDELFDSIGAEGARSVIELFIGETRDHLATIAAAAAADADAASREQASRAAHSMKSAAGQIGAAALGAAAAAVERAAAEDAPDRAQMIAALGRCAEDTLAALTALLA